MLKSTAPRKGAHYLLRPRLMLALAPLLLGLPSIASADAFGSTSNKAVKDLEERLMKLETELAKVVTQKVPDAPEKGPAAAKKATDDKPLSPEELGYTVRGLINGVRIVDTASGTQYLDEKAFKKFTKEAAKAAMTRRERGEVSGPSEVGSSFNIPTPEKGGATPMPPAPPPLGAKPSGKEPPASAGAGGASTAQARQAARANK